MKLNDLNALLADQLKDLYSAETQLLKALPQMAKHASSEAAKAAFTTHLTETEGQVERLNRAADLLGIKLSGKKCKAMEGLIEEGKECMEEEGVPAVLDGALIAAAQRVEHYEISAYGTARSIANFLGNKEVAALLQQTLEEESKTDELLTQLAEGQIYPQVGAVAARA